MESRLASEWPLPAVGSLLFLHLNLGKRSVVLDQDSVEGYEALLECWRAADVVVVRPGMNRAALKAALRTTKLAINQAQAAMGFTAHIHNDNAHSTSMCRRMGSLDPGYVLPKARGGKRQPLVQVALERHQRDQQRLAGKDVKKPKK